MHRLLSTPHDAVRGDIVQEQAKVPPMRLIGEHLLYWTDQQDQLDSSETSMRADVSRVLIKRLSGLVELHAQYVLSHINADPFTGDQQKEFQLRGSTALSASLLARQPAVKEYVSHSRKATSAEMPLVCFDPGDRDLRWHVLPGAESDIIPGYVPSTNPLEWYEGDDFFVRSIKGADPTDNFNDSYLEYYGNQFEALKYKTLTPILSGDLMQSLSIDNIPVAIRVI